MFLMVYEALQMHYSSPIAMLNIYNHTRMDVLYMCVYVHYGIYVYIHRNGEIYLFMCYVFIYLYAVFSCVCL